MQSESERDFIEVHFTSAREVTWSVRNLNSIRLPLDSPPFVCQNATWCLRLDPNGDHDIGIKIVRLSSRVPRHKLKYTMELEDDGIRHCEIADFDEDHKEAGNMRFDSQHYSLRLRDHQVIQIRRRSIHVTCEISYYGLLYTADGSSQTDLSMQEAKDGVTSQSLYDLKALCRDFKNMLLNGENRDVVLKVKDKEFPAHRDVLRARCPVFRSMLSHDTTEKDCGVVDIPDCDPSAFEQFLSYLYGGEVDTLDPDTMLSLYCIADNYDAGHLKENCRKIIEKSVSTRNVTDVVQTALDHRDEDHLRWGTDYFANEMDEILPTVEWMSSVEWMSFLKRNTARANELYIKAAKGLQSTNAGIVQSECDPDFSEVPLTSAREITWNVRRSDYIVSRPLDSPAFVFQNATWCLRLFQWNDNFIYLKIVRLSSRVPRHKLNYRLKLMDDATKCYKSVEFDEDHKEHASFVFPNYPASSVEMRNRVTCGISCYGLYSSDGSTQTDLSKQEGKDVESLCQDFKNMLLNGQNRDVVLKVKDKEFRAHRDVLRVRSPVFQSMLGHDMTEKNLGVVDIPDCDPSAFEQFLNYLYGGPVGTVDAENMLSLYYVADKYDAGHLKEKCREFIKKSLSARNITDVVQIASDHSDEDLLRWATDYFAKKVNEILLTVEWMLYLKRNPARANELFMKAAKGLLDSKQMAGSL